MTRGGSEIIGRYALHGEIASGGMAVVHLGKLLGAAGFTRPVAIKRVQPQLAREQHVRDMFVDEARLASRIRHPNVVPVLDVVADRGELLLVMDYVHGESLQHLIKALRRCGERVPLRITLAVMSAVLHGLHAAHEATTEAGEPLHIVHRDVSPQNVMIGVDGVPRVLDFGIARAAVRLENTCQGIVKGKLAYMAPEQLGGTVVDRRADVYAAAVVLWEMLAGRRLFVNEDGGSVMVEKLLRGTIEAPSTHAPGVPKLLDAITLHGLARSPEQRFATAREMAMALEKVGELARPSEIGDWVERLAAEALAERRLQLREMEMTASTLRVSTPPAELQLSDLFDSDDADDGGPEGDGDGRLGDLVPTVRPPPPPGQLPTPAQAMAVPVTASPPPRTEPHAGVVFGGYMLLGAALVLAAAAVHWNDVLLSRSPVSGAVGGAAAARVIGAPWRKPAR